MTRVNRSVAKFIKIYKNTDKSEKIDNFADQQMKKIVDEFRINRKRNKKSRKVNKINTVNNNNNNLMIKYY